MSIIMYSDMKPHDTENSNWRFIYTSYQIWKNKSALSNTALPFVPSWPLPPFFNWKQKSTDTTETSPPSELLVQGFFVFPYPSFTSTTPSLIEDKHSQN